MHSELGRVVFKPRSKYTYALVERRSSTGGWQRCYQQSCLHIWHEDWTTASQVRLVSLNLIHFDVFFYFLFLCAACVRTANTQNNS